MDNFDVLVESIGFKSQSSRSTPLSKLKSQPTKPNFPPPQQPPPTSSIPHSNISGGGTGIDLDAFFVGNSSSSAGLYHHVDDDIFGLNSIKNSHDDLISGLHSMGSLNGGNTKKEYPGHSGAPSYPSSSFAVDPFSIFESSSSSHEEKSSSKNVSSIDELEAFAMGSSQNNGSERSGVKISNEAVTRVQEKLSNSKYHGKKGNAASNSNIKVSLPRKEGRASKVTHGSQHFSPTEKVSTRGQTNNANNSFGNEDLLGSWFTEDSRTTTKTGPKDDVLDSLVSGKTRSNMENTSSHSSRGTKKAPVNTNYVDDFLVFGEPAAPSAVEFFEIDGEPEERRRARFNQHMRTKERMAKALSEKNQRDLHAQNEQEERRRLAESMDNNLKRWAAGKEGNLRALLSSLQHVLWAESGWQPVSLTDMITSVSVKKVYHRATLCVHPDKVQQKGATIQQKYIAEKVFDLLKEAWNKFNEQELR